MGIFTMVRGICDKCGKMTIFDGPFSDCGCYSPSDIDNDTVFLDPNKEVIEESNRLMKKIKKEIREQEKQHGT